MGARLPDDGVQFTWRNRCVMLCDGSFYLSARGDPDDFDFSAGDAGSAVAGTPGAAVLAIERVDGDRLRLETASGSFILEGDDFYGRTDKPARIYPEQ